jgi:hypothetical protein
MSIGSYASPSLPWQRHNTIPLTPDLNCATASSLGNTNAISRQQHPSQGNSAYLKATAMVMSMSLNFCLESDSSA